MALLGGKRLHLILTDSRAAGVEDLIRKAKAVRELVEFRVCKGAKFLDLADEAEQHLKYCPFDVVYIVGGACDITTKDASSGRITYDWVKGNELSSYLITSLTNADSRLRKYYPASKVVFCPLIGSVLDKVVTSHKLSPTSQEEVNSAVWEFNNEVFKISRERGTFLPALQHQVHRYCKGVRRNYYHHLPDGLHLSESLKIKWANQFINSIAHN